LPDATVNISGDGSGAEAIAAVGANGAITGIKITNPGSGYTTATVNITGAGSAATAEAVVNTTGSVTSITVASGGLGYTAPQVTISGGGGTGTIKQVGHSLMPGVRATDSAPIPGILPIFVGNAGERKCPID
jgi:hypothetical protein